MVSPRRMRSTRPALIAAVLGTALLGVAPAAQATDITNPAEHPDPITLTIDGQTYRDGADTLPGYDDYACTPIPNVQYDFADDQIQYYDDQSELVETAHWTEWTRISSYETWAAQQQAGSPSGPTTTSSANAAPTASSTTTTSTATKSPAAAAPARGHEPGGQDHGRGPEGQGPGGQDPEVSGKDSGLGQDDEALGDEAQDGGEHDERLLAGVHDVEHAERRLVARWQARQVGGFACEAEHGGEAVHGRDPGRRRRVGGRQERCSGRCGQRPGR